MNNNGTNPGMNVDDYENMAVQKSNTAKRLAAGAAMLVGGAAVGGGAAYAAANHDVTTDDALTTDDVVDGANVGDSYEATETTQAVATTTEHVVYVEEPAEPAQPAEPEVTWDDTTTVYDAEGNAVITAESGTVDGKTFAIYDVDGDQHADYLAVDVNGNGQFDADEIESVDYSDHLHMGHETAHTHDIYTTGNGQYVTSDDNSLAQNEPIHNDFEDEKTGESYEGDFAEDNPDYNSSADINDYGAQDDTTDGYGETSGAYGDTADNYGASDDMDMQDDYSDMGDDSYMG